MTYTLPPVSLLRKLVARGPILSLLRLRSSRRNRVLLYHRVVGDGVDPLLRRLLPGVLSCSEFRAQMQYLARHYPVVPLAELLMRRAEPGNRVAITFDDGYADNLHHAMPILREFGLPATVFVVAGYVDSERRFWWDVLARRIAANGPKPLLLETGAGSASVPHAGRYDRQLHAAAAWLGRLAIADRETALAGESPHPDDRVLTRDELLELERNGVQIEAHTMSHPRLAGLAHAEVERELVLSKSTLEGMLDRSVRYFAYPFGERGDFDRVAEQAARSAGFEAAFAAYRGVLDGDCDLFALPRIPTNRDLDRFKLRLARY
ncbi:MAG: polysaccharide deacetylase family protein [Polyangiaceae bacterium]